MKNIFKQGISALFTLYLVVACSPMDTNDYSLGKTPTEDQLAFTANPTSAKPNIIDLKNESKLTGVAVWDFGNGATSKGEAVKASYPFKGTYTITMTLYTQGGSAFTTKEVIITEDDMSLLDTPMYNALTGGANKSEGKTWVYDQYHAGNFGVSGVDWEWHCSANEKEGSSLYTQEFTFIQIGVKMLWKNNGSIYTNSAGVEDLKAKGYPNSVKSPVDDFDVEYAPKTAYTFTLDEASKTLSLSDGAFLGHYAGTSVYEIVKLTEDELYVKCKSTLENGNTWWYRFVPKEKNVKPEIPLKAAVLNEDFEGAKMKIVFKDQDMKRFIPGYDNPAPVPVNSSKKVCLYEKSSAFYSSISFTAANYKFDLSSINKVKMKVYIPDYNDYKKVYEVAGDWVAFNQLQKQVAVKLQDSSLGDDAYTTQTEIVKSNLQVGTWLELEFDFSLVKDRQDYDKILIQFGAEGHAGEGIFFFDDFSFDK